MPSSAFRRALYDAASAESLLELVEIRHATFATPLRWTSNNDAVVHAGGRFEPEALTLSLPPETDDLPSARVDVADLDGAIGDALDGLLDVEIRLRIVRAMAPDVAEVDTGWLDVQSLRRATGQLRLTAGLGDLKTEPYPAGSFTPDSFPGLL